MKWNFGLGFVTGAACTAALFIVLDGTVRDPRPGAGAPLPAGPDSTDAERAEPGSRAAALQPEFFSDGARSDEPVAITAAEPAAAPAGEPAAREPTQMPPRVVGSRIPPLSDTHVTMLLPEESEELSNNSIGIKEVHAQLEHEERDESWAYYMEGLLRARLAEPRWSAVVTRSQVDCRMTMCEVQVIGLDRDNFNEMVLMGDILAQPWAREFYGHWGVSNEENGARYFAVVLQRRLEQ